MYRRVVSRDSSDTNMYKDLSFLSEGAIDNNNIVTTY
jgi:hypothetical protein